jgi:hypothetical protein
MTTFSWATVAGILVGRRRKDDRLKDFANVDAEKATRGERA